MTAKLEKQIAALEAEVRRLKGENDDLRETNDKLFAENNELLAAQDDEERAALLDLYHCIRDHMRGCGDQLALRNAFYAVQRINNDPLILMF